MDHDKLGGDAQIATPALNDRAVNAERERVRSQLVCRFHIRSEFVRVALISKILGINAGSIYAQMARRTFPINHYRLGRAVVVKFDDLLDWYVGMGIGPNGVATEANLPVRGMPSSNGGTMQRRGEESDATGDDDWWRVPPLNETAKQRAQRIMRDVDELMRKQSLGKPKAGMP